MTLILYIPCDNGCILLSDRQNTYPDAQKSEVTKIHVQGELGPAIGCSGGTDIIRSLYTRIMDTWETNDGNVRGRIKDCYEKVLEDARKTLRHVGTIFDPDLEMLGVEVAEGQLKPFRINVLLDIGLNANRISAVPEGIPEVQRYLAVNTGHLCEGQAILLGEEILRQVSFSNYKVGAPEYHGYDYVRISAEGKFTVEYQEGSLQRLELSEVLRRVKIEGEKAA